MTDTPYALSVTTSVLFAVALLCATLIAASTSLSRQQQQKWPVLLGPALAAYAEPLIDLVQTSVVLGLGRASAASLAAYSDALSWTLWHRQPAFAVAQTCERARSDFTVGYVFVVLISWAVIVTLFYILKALAPRVALHNTCALATAVLTSQLVGASMTLGAGAASECAIGVLLGILMFVVVAAAALWPPIAALISIEQQDLVSFSPEVAQAEAAKVLPQAGVWTARDQGADHELRHWGFMLHMHTSAPAALSSFIVRCCRRVAIGIAGGATLAAAGARPTAPAAVVLTCCIIEATHMFLRHPNSSLVMNATSALSLAAQLIAACLMLAAADSTSTAAADAAMWILFVSSIVLSLATACALPFHKPLCPDNWASPPQPSSHSPADTAARQPGQHVSSIGATSTNGSSAAVGSTPTKALVASSSNSSIEKMSGMSLTVSVLQFKQLLGDLPHNHVRSLLYQAGAASFTSSHRVPVQVVERYSLARIV
jgi:hypothetical protein